MNYRSVADLNTIVTGRMGELPGVDVVIGIPRSGMLAATLLALHLNKPLADIDGFIEGRLLSRGSTRKVAGQPRTGAECRTALVVDDSVSSGQAIRGAREQLEGALPLYRFFFAAVYVTPEARGLVDFAFELVPKPRVFEWNVMHHPYLSGTCMDIDGVLCRDPRPDENDDGPYYQRFLETAEPLYLPTYPVGWLVTSRMEKYRRQTEEWMTRHGVEYGELRMLDVPNVAARPQGYSHGAYKAAVYENTTARLFIESDPHQAHEIATRAARPVYCLTTRQMIQPGIRSIGTAALRRAPAEMPRRWRHWASRAVRGLLQGGRA